MVNVPVVTTLATALPLMVPISALETAAERPGPPCTRPVSPRAISTNTSPVPIFIKIMPKRAKRKMYSTATPIGTPKKPSVERNSVEVSRARS